MDMKNTPDSMGTPLRLTRLRVDQVRRFRQPLVLDGLAPGLNIFAGPNEAGKSTLVRAIRAAFLERCRSSAVEDLRPWGEGSAAPSVEIDFELAGVPHRLVKGFLGRKRCTLDIGGTLFDSAAAEDHLARLFGYSFATKGAGKPEHAGIPGLLWVEQGRGHDLEVSHARDHLHDALSGLSAAGQASHELAATGGDELLDRLQKQRAELLTPGGRPRGEWAEVTERVATLRLRLQTLDEQIREYRHRVDELAQWKAEHDTERRERPWDALRDRLSQAEAVLAQIVRRSEGWKQDQSRLQQAEQTRDLLVRELQHLSAQTDAAAQRSAAWQAAQDRWAAQKPLSALARERAQLASAHTQTTRDKLNIVRQEARRAALLLQQQEATHAEAAALAQLERAQSAQSALQALMSEAPGTDWSTDQMTRLQQLERAERDAALQRQAVATRLHHALAPGATLHLDGSADTPRTLSGEGDLLLDAPTTFELPGLGRLTLTPGGQDLAARLRRHEHAQDQLREALQALGVASLDEAIRRHALQTEHQTRVAAARQAVSLLAPNGLEPWHAELARLRSRRMQASEALALLPPTASGAGALPTLPEAESEHEAAQAAEQAARQQLVQAENQEARWRGELENAAREHQAAQALLQEEGRSARQAQTSLRLLEVRAECTALHARVQQAQADMAADRPDWVRQDIERLQASVEQRLLAHQQRHEKILQLQARLQEVGAEGLEELRALCEGDLARAQRREDELSCHARSLDLLCRMIEARRQAALDRLQAPLLARIAHYLPQWLPGATLEMNASLGPGRRIVQLAGEPVESGEIDALSFGTREQITLISRLAYADLLQQAGRPTLIILDDALVHSDAMRLAQMKRVLYDAARRHQILLFTCHPQDWADMGVGVKMLQGAAA